MVQSFLVRTEIQKRWIAKFKQVEDIFKQRAAENDIQGQFPFENIKWLVDEGYTKLTLPKEYGGEGATIEDMVILQSYLGAIDGATALSIDGISVWLVNYMNKICGSKVCSIHSRMRL